MPGEDGEPGSGTVKLRFEADATRIDNPGILRARDVERPHERLRWLRWSHIGDPLDLKNLIGSTVPRPSDHTSTFFLTAAFHINAEVAALEADGAIRVELPELISKTVSLPLNDAAVLAGNIKHFAGVHRADEPSISGKPLVGTAMQLPNEHIVAAGVHVKGKP